MKPSIFSFLRAAARPRRREDSLARSALAGRLLTLAMLSLIVASLVWQSWSVHTLLHEQSIAPVATATEQPATLDDDALLPLFADAAVAADRSTPNTNLHLTLLGSFAHAQMQHSSAIIQAENSKARRYAIGAELSPGVSLHAVYPERVELMRNGRLESLTFKRSAQAHDSGDNLSPPADFSYAAPEEFPSTDAQQLHAELETLQEQIQPSTGADEPTELSTEGSQ